MSSLFLFGDINETRSSSFSSLFFFPVTEFIAELEATGKSGGSDGTQRVDNSGVRADRVPGKKRDPGHARGRRDSVRLSRLPDMAMRSQHCRERVLMVVELFHRGKSASRRFSRKGMRSLGWIDGLLSDGEHGLRRVYRSSGRQVGGPMLAKILLSGVGGERLGVGCEQP